MIKVLAVEDPAVLAYTDSNLHILEDFKTKSNIDVQFDVVPWVDYYDKYQKALVSNDYDIVMVAGHLWLKDLLEKDLIHPLDYSDELIHTIVPEIVDECMYEHQIYLSPSFCDGHIVVSNQPLQKKLMTVEDLVLLSEQTPVVLKAHESEIGLDFLPYLRHFQGELVDAFGHRAYSDSQLDEALKMYKNILQKEPMSKEYGNEEIKNQILKGLTAVTWSGQLGHILKDLPKYKKLYTANLKDGWFVTWGFSLLKSSNSKQESTSFLNYTLSEEVDRKVGRYCGNPVLMSTYELNEEMYPVVLNMYKYATQLPLLKETGQLLGELTSTIQSKL